MCAAGVHSTESEIGADIGVSLHRDALLEVEKAMFHWSVSCMCDRGVGGRA